MIVDVGETEEFIRPENVTGDNSAVKSRWQTTPAG
jgi:hypothetical protein